LDHRGCRYAASGSGIDNGSRLTQGYVFALVRRLARIAGIPAAEQISPYSLRHSAATAALDDGAPLRDVQDLLGRADPRTTRRYDRNRGSLDRSPAHRLGVQYDRARWSRNSRTSIPSDRASTSRGVATDGQTASQRLPALPGETSGWHCPSRLLAYGPTRPLALNAACVNGILSAQSASMASATISISR
jgi:hypothetical protein